MTEMQGTPITKGISSRNAEAATSNNILKLRLNVQDLKLQIKSIPKFVSIPHTSSFAIFA